MVNLGKNKIALMLAISLVSAAELASQHATAQGPATIPIVVDDWLGNVVHINSPPNQVGFGLIVGRDADIVWIATAAHVVQQQDPVTGFMTSSPSISVDFKKGFNSAAGIKVLGGFFSSDLAFVSVRAPLDGNNFDAWRRRVIGSEPTSDTPLILSGVGDRIEFERRAGRGALIDRSACALIGTVAIGLTGFEGQSGAPVASSSGFVGIYVGKNGNVGCMVPMENIRRSAIDARIPWLLEKPEFSDNTLVRFCIAQNGPERPTLRLAGLTALALDDSGCVSAPVMPYRIMIDQPWLIQCLPNPITPNPRSTSPIKVSCRPKVDGIWRSQTMGTFTVREKTVGATVVPDVWLFEGLNLVADGPFQGEIRAAGSELQLNGKTFGGMQITGQLTVERTRATGNIMTTSGRRYDLLLTR